MQLADGPASQGASVRARLTTPTLLTCALWLQASTPTRIAEAEPYIQAVIDKQKIDKPTAQLEATPHLMLAAAIHKTPGREAEAYKLLKDALKNGDNGANPPTILMAKASVARALRRVYRVREAKELETAVMYVHSLLVLAYRLLMQSRCSRWILDHQHVPPSMIRKDVGDAAAPPGTRDMILDDPRLKKYFSSRVEMPGMGMFGGTAVITFG